jgi:hypothetical protein
MAVIYRNSFVPSQQLSSYHLKIFRCGELYRELDIRVHMNGDISKPEDV